MSDYLNKSLSKTPTLRGVKRCANVSCEELVGFRAKRCKKCNTYFDSADTTASDITSSCVGNAQLEDCEDRIIVELQNSFGNQSQRYFSVREKTPHDSSFDVGITIIENDIYSHRENTALVKVCCYVPTCVARNSQNKTSKVCDHGKKCLENSSVVSTSKCLPVNWTYVFNKVCSLPDAVKSNLTTVQTLFNSFGYTSQPVQKLDRTTYVVFGPKSSVEQHGVAHINFDLNAKTYNCSCVSFLESGTTNSYESVLGQVRVCYHIYLLFAAFLSDYNYRERHKISSKFCHVFLKDTVPAELRSDSTEIWEKSKRGDSVAKEKNFETIENINSDHISQNIGIDCVAVHPDLYVCNLIHIMREALKPFADNNTVCQTTVSAHLPVQVFEKLEPRIAGLFGNEWKAISPKVISPNSDVSESGCERTRVIKQWDILVSKTFNYFMTLSDKKLKNKFNSCLSLEKFFMQDVKEGFVEVGRCKIEQLIQNCFHHNDSSLHGNVNGMSSSHTTTGRQHNVQQHCSAEMPALNNSYSWSNANECNNHNYDNTTATVAGANNRHNCQVVSNPNPVPTFKRLKPSFISSQAVIGRHPKTGQQLPCNFEWCETSPLFGCLKITFFYAKKVNGCFV